MERFSDYGQYLTSLFGKRVQKVSLDLGFSCLKNQGNRCAWCVPKSFMPCNIDGIVDFKQQFLIAKDRFQKRYVNPAFLLYFQSEASSASDLSVVLLEMEELYYTNQVDGFVFGIRPEDVNSQFIETIEYIKLFKRSTDRDVQRSKPYISIELGIQSIKQESLDFSDRASSITFADTLIETLKDLEVELATHIIFGLPFEGAGAMIRTVDWLNYHQFSSVKFHHLQIFSGSKFEEIFREKPKLFPSWTDQEYMEEIALAICKLSPEIKIQRFINDSSRLDPKKLSLVHPKWEIKKNYHFTALLRKYMGKQDLWQGKYYGTAVLPKKLSQSY